VTDGEAGLGHATELGSKLGSKLGCGIEGGKTGYVPEFTAW